MALIEPINCVRTSLIIDLMSVEFGVHYGTISLILVLSTAICFGKETESIETNEDNDPFKTH